MRSGPPSSSVPRWPEIICARPAKVSAVTCQVCATPPHSAAGSAQTAGIRRCRRECPAARPAGRRPPAHSVSTGEIRVASPSRCTVTVSVSAGMRRDDALDVLERLRSAAPPIATMRSLASSPARAAAPSGSTSPMTGQGDRPSDGHEQAGEQHHREQEIRDRPGGDDDGARAHRLFVEGLAGYPARARPRRTTSSGRSWPCIFT